MCSKFLSQHALQDFFLQVCNCSVDGQGKCDLDKGALRPKPVKDITAFSGNVDQSKLDSQIGLYILCILIKYITAEGNTNAKERTQYSTPGRHLPSTNVWHPHKIGLQIPWWRKWREG